MSLGRYLFPLLKLVPKNSVSHVAGKLAYSRSIPKKVHRCAIKAFAKKFKVNLNESAETNAESFSTFGEFFTRTLKDGARPLEKGIVCPCDGVLSQGGPIQKGMLTQVKGIHYSLPDLLHDTDLVKTFENGSYATIYLSPRHYHRVHSPVDGSVIRSVYTPGNLWPVNSVSVERMPSLFCKNERLLTLIESTDWGKVAVIFVGATIVGHIHLSYSPELWDYKNLDRHTQEIRHEPHIDVKRGQELGYFTLGSTIILLLEKKHPLFKELGQDLKWGVTLFDSIVVGSTSR